MNMTNPSLYKTVDGNGLLAHIYEHLVAQTVVSLGALEALWAGVGKKILPFEDQQRFTVVATKEVRSARLKLLEAAAEGLSWKSLQPDAELAKSFGAAAWAISRVGMFRWILPDVVA